MKQSSFKPDAHQNRHHPLRRNKEGYSTRYNSMLRLFCTLLITCSLSSFQGTLFCQNDTPYDIILEAAECTIRGKTNVNSFSCHMENLLINDILAKNVCFSDRLDAFKELEILFKVEDFKCDLALMTTDFRQLLKMEEYPFIRMKIDEVRLKEPSSRNQLKAATTVCVLLYIAGVQTYEEIAEAKIAYKDDRIILSGTHHVRMTDFEIIPPTRLMGAIRTSNHLEIHFSIVLRLK